MEDIRNTIISISGQPASGKSTVVAKLKEEFEQQGHTVHIEPVGQYWREAAVETYKKMKPEIENPTIDEIHADPEFETFRKQIDLALDEKVRQRGEEINSQARPNEVFIFDSRLAWKNIPSSYAVRLTVDEKIAGTRVFEDKKRGKEDQYPSVEAAIEATRVRTEEENKRYKMRYDIDLENLENYDLIIDTSFCYISELATIIREGAEAYRQGKEYPKMWANPAIFLTAQKTRQTNGRHVKELTEIMLQKGYNSTDGTLSIAENEGIKILTDGNHRVYAGLSTGKTLFPYKITNRDNEYSREKANRIYDDPTLECIYDWAEIVLSYYGGEVGKIESLKGVKPEELIAVAKVPKLRKIFGLDKPKEEPKKDTTQEEQDGEDR